MSTLFDLVPGDRATFIDTKSDDKVTVTVTIVDFWGPGGAIIYGDKDTLRAWDGWQLVEVVSYAGGIPNADSFSWTNSDGFEETAVRYLAATDRMWIVTSPESVLMRHVTTTELAQIVNGAKTTVVPSHR